MKKLTADQKLTLALCTYILMTFFTGGYYYNLHPKDDRGFFIYASIAWPIYWMSVLSVEATAWARPEELK